MPLRSVLRLRAAPLAALLCCLLLWGACAGSRSGGGTPASGSAGHLTLRLGYFPNITHATAPVGVEQGIFARDLGSGITLQTATFNAGPAEVEALFSGALDAGYMGYGATVTPQLFVLDRERNIAYMGKFDDDIEPEKAQRSYVRDAVHALLDGKRPDPDETRATGCGIEYGKPQ